MVSFRNINSWKFRDRFHHTKKYMKKYFQLLKLTSSEARKLSEKQMLDKIGEKYEIERENVVIRSRVKNLKVFEVEAMSIIEAKVLVGDLVKEYTKRVLDAHGSIKFGGTLYCLMSKPDIGVFYPEKFDVQVTIVKDFFSGFKIVRDGDHMKELVDGMFAHFEKSLDEFLHHGSGWKFENTLELHINVWKQKVTKAGSNSWEIKLPKHIADKKAIAIPQNVDEECFRWCMKYHQSAKEKNGERLTVLRKVDDKFDYGDMEFPASDLAISKFCVRNNVNILVFHEQRGNIVRKQCVICDLSFESIYLFYIPHPTKKDYGHFTYVKNVSRLMNNLKAHGKSKFCRVCCSMYHENTSHSEKSCQSLKENGASILLTKQNGMPLEDVEFINIKKQHPIPFFVFADFETTLEEYDMSEITQVVNKSDTKLRQKHVPNSYCYDIVTSLCENQNNMKRSEINSDRQKEIKKKYERIGVMHVGENPAKHLLESLLKEQGRLQKALKVDIEEENGRLHTVASDYDFKHAKVCYLCGEKFGKGSEKKVWDHCHTTGVFKGAAHSKCNFVQSDYVLPVVFHNLQGYDGHLLIREAKLKGFDPRVIPTSGEKYMSIRIGKLNFIDSMSFMNSSLSKLTENLKASNPDRSRFDVSIPFIERLHKKIESKMDIKLFTEMILQKGVYPYSFMKSTEVFKNEEFPLQTDFFDFLTQSGIGDEDYAHGKRVYVETKCKTFLDYHKLYLAMDVHLLADVFMNFRRTLLDNYGLDCGHYMSLPGFSWDAMLKYRPIDDDGELKPKVKLELIKDYEILALCEGEKAKRGGLCFVNHRYAKSNNPDSKQYDQTKPISDIVYMDANSLYGWAMTQFLPYGGHHFYDGGKDTEKRKDEIMLWSDENETGAFLEVDFYFPDDVHDKLEDYPPCPENMEITYDMLKGYNKEICERECGKNYKAKKLTPHLGEHKKYVCDYRLLKKAVALGAVITKVYRILEFKQSAWLKPYIDKCTQYRKEAKNDFDKDVFKLLINSIYGKTCENIRNRRTIKITSDPERALKWVSKNTFINGKVEDGMYYIELCKERIVYNRPSYVGIAVLDISKKLMLDFHYDFMMEKYGKEKAKLLYSDTDSLVYHVTTPNFLKDISSEENRHEFDLSNMPKDSPYYCEINKKKAGVMKVETGANIIEEFVALRPKSYAYHGIGVEDRKCKGIQRNVVKKVMKYQDWKTVLDTGKSMYHKTYGFVSKTDQIYSYEMKKKSLSAFYDKMHVFDDGIRCLPYGHYKLRELS